MAMAMEELEDEEDVEDELEMGAKMARAGAMVVAEMRAGSITGSCSLMLVLFGTCLDVGVKAGY